MEENFHVNILDKFQVSPLPDSITQSVSLPLTYFDIPWLSYAPNQTLFFYRKPPSETTTTAILAALLKQSLSHALHNFYPLAGTLTLPPPPAEPYMVYTKGDTISLTIAESSNNFNHLSGNHPRDITHLYSLLPKLPSPSMSARDSHVSLIDLPLLAIQITFFGELGFSIGVASQHAAADERTLYEFMKCWASFCKSLLEKESLFEFEFTFTPWFNRSVILDQNSLKTTLLKQWWNRLNSQKTSHEETKLTNHEIVQSTFVLSLSDINIIKHHIIEKCKMANDDPPLNLSLYETGVSYTWICLLKVQEITHDHAKDGNTNIYLGYNASGIARLKYEVPLSYFGCCIVFGRCGALESELLSEDGLVCATKSFDNEIERLVTDFLEGSERWICEWDELNTRIIGSPKVDFYGIDFGWGKAEKIEKLSSDDLGHHGRVINVISLNGGKDLNGGLEIGVVLPKDKMSEFTCIFNSGLKEL